jgi:hypothetical protein
MKVVLRQGEFSLSRVPVNALAIAGMVAQPVLLIELVFLAKQLSCA